MKALVIFYSALLSSAILAGWTVAGCDRGGPTLSTPPAPAGMTAAPLRIISTMPSTTEMLFALGAGERLVGVSRFCDLPPEAGDLPRVGSGLDPDLEVMISLHPDLVVGTIAQRDLPFLGALANLGIGNILVDDTRLDLLLADMIRLGEAVHAADAARRLVALLQEGMDHLAERTRGRSRPRVLLLFHHQPLYAAGPETFLDALIEAAGGQNVLAAGDWVQLDIEQLIHLAPEVILVAGEVDYPVLRGQLESLDVLPAVHDGRVYRLTARGLSRPGPGVLEVALEMARDLHPELFPELSP